MVYIEKSVKRGDIWYIDFGQENIIGSEQAGYRPILIIQNDAGNKYSSTTIGAVITSQQKKCIPTHMETFIYEPSTILFEQIKTVDKQRLIRKVKTLTKEEMEEAEKRMLISLGITK